MTIHIYTLRSFSRNEFKLFCNGDWVQPREDGWFGWRRGRGSAHVDFTTSPLDADCADCLQKALVKHEQIVKSIKEKIAK